MNNRLGFCVGMSSLHTNHCQKYPQHQKATDQNEHVVDVSHLTDLSCLSPLVSFSDSLDRNRREPCRSRPRLLQTELLSRCQPCERFANTPFPPVRSLGHVNPNDEVTAGPSWQLPRRTPACGRGLCGLRGVL